MRQLERSAGRRFDEYRFEEYHSTEPVLDSDRKSFKDFTMNWDAIGALGEIVGAIAVIGTLIYLARQISESVGLARASQNRNIMESYEAYNDLILANRDVAALLAKLENTTADVSPEENVRLRHLAYRMMNIWSSAELSYSNGQLGPEEFDLYKNDVKSVADQYPGIIPYVISNLDLYPAMKQFKIYDVLRDRGHLP